VNKVKDNLSSQDQSALSFSFTLEGEQLSAEEGDSIASAMVRNRQMICRITDEDKPRGIFCGMGVCNECAVEIDGVPGQLSCMKSVKPGMEINYQEQHRLAPLASTDSVQLPEVLLTPDLLIIGAGPAGLTLAKKMRNVAGDGFEILIIDERKSPGGQYFKQRQLKKRFSREKLDKQFREGADLISEVKSSGITILTGVTIWGAFDPDHLLGEDEKHRYIFRAKNLVLATGAYERGVAMPGWTLPGVMTTGASQTLLRSYSVSPGDKVLIAGNGPLNLQMAAELCKVGVQVVGLVESGRIFSLRSAALTPLLFLVSPTMALRGVGYFLQIKSKRVPYLSGACIAGFEGDQRVTSARIHYLSDEISENSPQIDTQFEVDAVSMGYGFIPSNEIAKNLGCRHILDKESLALKTETSLDGATSREKVWSIGDGANINGAQVAKLRASLLAISLLQSVGKGKLIHRIKKPFTQVGLLRQLLFQKILWNIYKSPKIFDQFTTDETIICRCLSVTKGRLMEDISADLVSAGALKRISRAGMGKCQGRYCSPYVQKFIEDVQQTPGDEYSGFAPQLPIKPTSIGSIAYSADNLKD